MYLVIAPVISSPNMGFLFATILILSGLVFYYPFVYRKIELGSMSKRSLPYLGIIFITTSGFVFCRQNQYIFEDILSIATSRNQNLMVSTYTTALFLIALFPITINEIIIDCICCFTLLYYLLSR